MSVYHPDLDKVIDEDPFLVPPLPQMSNPFNCHSGQLHFPLITFEEPQAAPDSVFMKYFLSPPPAPSKIYNYSDQTASIAFLPDQTDPIYSGCFKGMETILKECEFKNAWNLRAECKNFKCNPPATDCCCWRILFNQPDFVKGKNIVEDTFNSRGFEVYFFPKFHCELNFIEQCWGYAKQLYCLNPESLHEDVLEQNVITALDAIPLVCIRRWAQADYCAPNCHLMKLSRFSTWTWHFVDAYHVGLTGSRAAWESWV